MSKKNQSKRKTASLGKVGLISFLLLWFIYLCHNITLFSEIENIVPNFKVQDTFLENFSNISSTSHQDSNLDNLSKENIVTKLQALSNQDQRINTILENIDEYPEELLDMLTRNLNMLDFVLEFPNKKGQVFSNTIGSIKKGTYPLLLQWDARWGYAEYGENYLAISGCAPTALAMVIAGLTGKNTITPYTVSQYALESGYYTKGVGTNWNLMTEGSKHFKVLGTEITLSKNSVYSSLKAGHPIICSMRPGDFTTQGHFIVLTAILDGKIKVNDPNSQERSNQLWDYETLEYQIKNLWSFQAL